MEKSIFKKQSQILIELEILYQPVHLLTILHLCSVAQSAHKYKAMENIYRMIENFKLYKNL